MMSSDRDSIHRDASPENPRVMIAPHAGVPFEVPRADERAERLESVLEVTYLVCNEGASRPQARA